jgi:hypothetical protein
MQFVHTKQTKQTKNFVLRPAGFSGQIIFIAKLPSPNRGRRRITRHYLTRVLAHECDSAAVGGSPVLNNKKMPIVRAEVESLSVIRCELDFVQVRLNLFVEPNFHGAEAQPRVRQK